MLKENILKSLFQKSGDAYFLVLTNKSKSKFKEKSSKSVWCEQWFLPETTTFKEGIPKLDCKSSVSYNDS